jgi:hypothetical protein
MANRASIPAAAVEFLGPPFRQFMISLCLFFERSSKVGLLLSRGQISKFDRVLKVLEKQLHSYKVRSVVTALDCR